MARRLQIVGGYLTGAAVKWYDSVKTLLGAWNGPFGFENVFLSKFASATRRNTWYMKYKACRQAGRTVDEYSIDFQQLWWKIDPQRAMPNESVLADYLSGLDPNIAMLVYGLAPLTVDDTIDKMKKVELGQMNASNIIQANIRLQQLEQQNFLLNSQIMQMQGQGTEIPRPQGSAAQKK